MNKSVMNAFKDFNISYNGNYGYGDMNGYEVNIYNSPMNQGPVLAISSYMLLSQKTDFVSKLNSRNFKLVKADSF